MSLKKILIIAGSLVIVIGLTIGILVIIKPQVGTQGVETTRGIKPTGNFVFNDISTVSSLPSFINIPKDSGWTKVQSAEETSFINVQLTNPDSCSFSAQSQTTPFPNIKLKDYELSKTYATTVAGSEQGTLSDVYVIKIKTSKDDADFYTGVYSPKISLTHPAGTTPTSEGGTTQLTGDYKTFIAVRSISTPLKSPASNTNVSPEGDTKYKNGEIITLGDTIPTIVLKYTCKASAFDVNAALKFVQQVKLDLNPSVQTTTTDTSVGK